MVNMKKPVARSMAICCGGTGGCPLSFVQSNDRSRCRPRCRPARSTLYRSSLPSRWCATRHTSCRPRCRPACRPRPRCRPACRCEAPRTVTCCEASRRPAAASRRPAAPVGVFGTPLIRFRAPPLVGAGRRGNSRLLSGATKPSHDVPGRRERPVERCRGLCRLTECVADIVCELCECVSV
jgi:hypothetical protein